MATCEERMSRRMFVAFGTGAVVASAGVSRVLAQDATPSPGGGAEQGGLPPLPAGATIVAEGLWNPTNLAFGADGTLYVAESGVSSGGGPEAGVATPDPQGTPYPGPAPLVPGQVSMIDADGAIAVLAAGLGSVVGIAVNGSTLAVSMGGGSIGSGFSPVAGENTVNAIDLASGTVTTLADLNDYEVANNPDGTDVNPNLYGLDVDANGLIYVADAGGNTIYTVNPADDTFALFAVVPTLEDLTGATPTAEEQAMQPGPRQPVPTAIVIDDQGAIHVSLLSEFWNGPSLLTYAADGTYAAASTRLSMVTNIALGPDGLLYAVQISDDIAASPPALGSVHRVAADGSTEPVVQGLFFPHGAAFDAAGNLYVTVNSIISGPDAPLGQIVRFDGIAMSA